MSHTLTPPRRTSENGLPYTVFPLFSLSTLHSRSPWFFMLETPFVSRSQSRLFVSRPPFSGSSFPLWSVDCPWGDSLRHSHCDWSIVYGEIPLRHSFYGWSIGRCVWGDVCGEIPLRDSFCDWSIGRCVSGDMCAEIPLRDSFCGWSIGRLCVGRFPPTLPLRLVDCLWGDSSWTPTVLFRSNLLFSLTTQYCLRNRPSVLCYLLRLSFPFTFSPPGPTPRSSLPFLASGSPRPPTQTFLLVSALVAPSRHSGLVSR